MDWARTARPSARAARARRARVCDSASPRNRLRRRTSATMSPQAIRSAPGWLESCPRPARRARRRCPADGRPGSALPAVRAPGRGPASPPRAAVAGAGAGLAGGRTLAPPEGGALGPRPDSRVGSPPSTCARSTMRSIIAQRSSSVSTISRGFTLRRMAVSLSASSRSIRSTSPGSSASRRVSSAWRMDFGQPLRLGCRAGA